MACSLSVCASVSSTVWPCPAATVCRFGSAAAVCEILLFIFVQECRRVCQTGNEMLRHFWASFPWTSKQREDKAAKLDRALASHYDRSAMLPLSMG